MPRMLRTDAPIIGQVAALVVVGGTALGMLAGACGWRFVCLVATGLALAAEPVLHENGALFRRLLRESSLGFYSRTLLRLISVLAVGTAYWTERAVGTAIVLSGAALALVLAIDNLLRIRMRKRRQPAIETRNIPLDGLTVPAAPNKTLVSGEGAARAAVELPIILAGCLVVGNPAAAWALGAIGVLGAAAVGVVMALQIKQLGTRLGPESMVRLVQKYLDTSKPTVLLYFSGNADSAYQVNMWLSTMERLPVRALVVLRERRVLESLGSTALPVICTPAATTLLALHFNDARVALYTANVGNNLHMLREPGTMSAFIGHGDSDKNASFNPFSRVYDEIWVAGDAGRERYRRAAIGVHEDQLVEVGRPQLDGIARAEARPAGHIPTVLYAPTWEGWDSEQDYCSLATAGRRLVEQVVNHPTPIRLVYKPHPFTGLRIKALRDVHADIVATIAAANAARGLAAPTSIGAADDADDTATDADTSTERAADDESGSAVDAITRAMRSGARPGPSAIDAEARAAAADLAYWNAVDPGLHVAVDANGPSLYACFNAADLLVTDISSVLSDFLASGKPYAVCNPGGVPAGEFVRTFPSTSAATLIGPDGAGLDTVIDLLDRRVEDTAGDARRALANDLLGSPEVPAMTRFGGAVLALAERSQERNDSRGAANGTDIDLGDDLVGRDGEAMLVGATDDELDLDTAEQP